LAMVFGLLKRTLAATVILPVVRHLRARPRIMREPEPLQKGELDSPRRLPNVCT
jgi:hypothetical protein